MCTGLVEFSIHLKEIAIHCHSNKHDAKHHNNFPFCCITANTVDCYFCSSILYVAGRSSESLALENLLHCIASITVP